MKDGKYLIALDAGHGGADAGAVSILPNLTESMLTLSLAKAIKERLLRSDKFEVWMSREEDISPGNASHRGTLIGKMKADFGLSIHFNAFSSESAHGTEIYVPNQETAATIEYNIQKEIVKLFTQRGTYAKGRNYTDGALTDKTINPSTLKFKHTYPNKDYYGVIREAWKYGVSVDLIEICFVTNRKDIETYLDNQDKVADIIAKAIYTAFGVTYIGSTTANVSTPSAGNEQALQAKITELTNEVNRLNDRINKIKELVM